MLKEVIIFYVVDVISLFFYSFESSSTVWQMLGEIYRQLKIKIRLEYNHVSVLMFL